ncbi:MAG: hypothetical protein DDT35_01323 [Firmicutes bacterium]|nr:hypothetical protein [Bacillota bacterium]
MAMRQRLGRRCQKLEVENINEIVISQRQARRFLVARQRYRANNSPFIGIDGVREAVDYLGAVQVDPINPFARNHDQVLFSRVAEYSPVLLDSMLYQQRAGFEYYCNALCVLPMVEYPYFANHMREVQAEYRMTPEVAAAAQVILAKLHSEGALMAREIQSGQRAAAWWDGGIAQSKVEKVALDVLHFTGQVMIESRQASQRRYDLPERLVPEAYFRQEIGAAECQEFMMDKFLRAYGLSQSTLYRFGWGRTPKKEAKAQLHRFVEQGRALAVNIEGVKRRYYCHYDHVPQLLADDGLSEGAEAVFVAPLDNLLWDRDRLLDFFAFHYRWEVYTPATKRTYGYYVLPILYGENFVGRIELRAWREQNALEIVKLWLDDPRLEVQAAIWRTASDIARRLGLELTDGKGWLKC